MNKLNKLTGAAWGWRFFLTAILISLITISVRFTSVNGETQINSGERESANVDSIFDNVAAPRYIGCFLDNNLPPSRPRDLSGFEWNDPRMTIEGCVASCAQRGFQYAGTQYGSYCFCGNSYGKYGALTSGEGRKCDTPCSGNSGQMCGGAWANSVYSVSNEGGDDVSMIPLKLYFNRAREDNFTTATSAGEQSALNSGYFFARTEGYGFSTQQPGTVPLKLYWSAAREDNYVTATSQGEGAAQAAGYTYVRVEGYIYSTQRPGTVPLKNFWSARAGDNFQTATAEGEQHAINSGYTFAWIEGYVLPAKKGDPPTPTPTPTPTPGTPTCDPVTGHWYGWSGDNSGDNFFFNPQNFPVASPNIWAVGGKEVVPSDPNHWDRWGLYKCVDTNKYKLENRQNGEFLTLTLRNGRLYRSDGRYACLNGPCQ